MATATLGIFSHKFPSQISDFNLTVLTPNIETITQTNTHSLRSE